LENSLIFRREVRVREDTRSEEKHCGEWKMKRTKDSSATGH
jgi:hypothetical protein